MKKKNKLNFKVLDCTLRDGGYYNNWNFSDKIVNEYVSSINQSGIDVVEIGFRFLKKNNNGTFANTKEETINNLKIKKNVDLALMINSSDFDNSKNYKSQIRRYFLPRKQSKISIIRLATHLKDLKKIIPHMKFLKKLGYKIAVNLMQIDKINSKNLSDALSNLKKTKSVDVFYFADSFGSLKPKHIEKICKTIKKNWNKDFGFHAHDNCGSALQNCLTAMNSGAKWIDSTIQGMGRGAGNVTTEDLLCSLQDNKNFKYNLKPIFKLSQNTFKKLKNKYNWGKSIYYHLSAKFNIHPSYIQELLIDDRYNHEEIINIIYSLKNIKSSSYSPIRLQEIIKEKINFKTAWNASSWCNKENILILGQGSSIQKNKSNIINFINKKKCKVISLNINEKLNSKLINKYVACNETRMIIDYAKYKKIYSKLILPVDRLKKILGKKISKKIKNYGLEIKKNKFKVFNNHCELPKSLVFGYAISLCVAGGAKKVYVAGFDGHKKNVLLNSEFNNYIKTIRKELPYLSIQSITPSNYKFNA
jgi:4-hydroxy 2-oxovalerate aldolase